MTRNNDLVPSVESGRQFTRQGTVCVNPFSLLLFKRVHANRPLSNNFVKTKLPGGSVTLPYAG